MGRLANQIFGFSIHPLFWLTFIDESMEDIENKLKEISKKTGVKDVRNLPTVRFFKIRVDFDMEK